MSFVSAALPFQARTEGSSDYTVLAVQEGPGQLVLFSAANPSHRAVVRLALKPHEIVVSHDGETAYVSNFGLLEANLKVGTPGTTISVIDVANAEERARYEIPESVRAPHGLKLRPPDEHELFTNAEIGDTMVVFQAKTGKIVRTFALPSRVHNFVFDRTGKAIFAFTLDGALVRIHPESGVVEARAEMPSTRGLAWTTDGSSLLVSGKNQVSTVNPSTLKTERIFGDLHLGQVFYPLAAPKCILAPAVLDGSLVALEPSTGKILQTIRTGSPLLAALSPDRRFAWISNVLVPATMLPPGSSERSGGITKLDLKTFETSEVNGIQDANGIAVSSQRPRFPSASAVARQ